MPAMPKPHFLVVHEGTAATWTTSTEVLDQDTDVAQFKSVPYPRILRNVGCIGDTSETAGAVQGVKVLVGGQVVAKIKAEQTLKLNRDTLLPVDCPVAPNESVSVTIDGASATNPFGVALDFDVDYAALAAMARGGRRRRF